ncbi:ferritin family protein [Planctomycetota bacterium]
MKKEEELKTYDRVIDFAIEREAEAEIFYRNLAGKVHDSAVQSILQEFAEEEALHKEKLERLKSGQKAVLSGRPAPRFRSPLDIAEPHPGPGMTLADALALAIKKEKAAYRLYLDLAVDAPTQELMDLFLTLAREEANHKVRFEIEYDDLSVTSG